MATYLIQINDKQKQILMNAIDAYDEVPIEDEFAEEAGLLHDMLEDAEVDVINDFTA